MMHNEVDQVPNVSDADMLEQYRSDLNDLLEKEDHLLGVIANSHDFLGELVLGIYKASMQTNEEPTLEDVLKAINGMFPYVEKDKLLHIGCAVNFHMAVTKINHSEPDLEPSWKDDHPLTDISEINFDNITNRYY